LHTRFAVFYDQCTHCGRCFIERCFVEGVRDVGVEGRMEGLSITSVPTPDAPRGTRARVGSKVA
jgi:hypothetical protein